MHGENGNTPQTVTGPRLALVAHDSKKAEMVNLIHKHADTLKNFQLTATAATGRLIQEMIGLHVASMLPGPQGGDIQIGAEIASGNIDAVIFLRDPLTAQPHEPDITALLRICDVHNVPVATNTASAELFLQAWENLRS